jgi:DNA-directed RNA polymerase specialized sigma24 family protein
LGPSDVTTLLRALSDGDLRAHDQLMPVVHGELQRRAAAQLRRERRDYTLQPTALGRWIRVTLDERVAEMPVPDVELLDLDAALTRLAAFDPRKSQIAELRFFGGLSLKETGHVLGLSIATVERDWQIARAWLFAAMKGAVDRDA